MIPLIDSHGRVLRDLRISVTDRCNFRCLYCLPETEAAANFYRDRWQSKLQTSLSNNSRLSQNSNSQVSNNSNSRLSHNWKSDHEILSFEEIERVARLVASCGIQKIRLTGGEPLLRKDLARLVKMLARIEGIRDLAMTSNGFLFPNYAADLREAGLHRINLSLDSFDKSNFKRMTGRAGLERVLKSIRLAKSLGFSPIRINAVIIKGLNDHEIHSLCQFALDEQISIRFIEFMPLDSRKSWQREYVISGREILSRLQTQFHLTPRFSENRSETARRWNINQTRAELGIIAPVSEPFCGHCNRLRLTSDGQIRTCLFSLREHDLKPFLRGKSSDEDLIKRLRSIVHQKEAGHKIGEPEFVQPARTMSCIGG